MTRRSVACAAGIVLGLSSAASARAEAPAGAEVDGIPAALTADLTADEEARLAETTSGEGVPLAAFVTTSDGPQILALDAGSRSDAVAAVALLDRQASVVAADLSHPVRATGGATWNIGNLMVRSEEARAGVDNPLSDVVVAVLDSGVHPHPELASALTAGQNFTTSGGGSLDTEDRFGHGTHVAGTVGADVASYVEGIAYGAKIMPVKVLGDNGIGYSDWLAGGIIWAADHGADVINMSLGSYSSSTVEAAAVDYARSSGVTVIAAAGNDNSAALDYPAAYPGVIGVSAVDWAEDKAPFSNHGSYVDVAAPGVDIVSTYNDDWFRSMSGTSMATPHVAGVAALVKGADPGLTPDQVEQALVASTKDLGALGRDDVYGHGLVDAVRAVRAANVLEANGALPARPGAPQLGVPEPGNTTVRVRWSPPADDGGSPVTGYTVRAFQGTTLLRRVGTSAGTRDLLISGLANGTPVTFVVDASNDGGSGATASVTATPVGPPGAPRIGTPSPGNGSAVVRWAAPLTNGGATVTGYIVRAYRGTGLVTTVQAAAGATAATVSGLANGAPYTFTVTARNALGVGPASATTPTVVPRTVPAAPRILGVSAGRSSATVSWSKPYNGGATITRYVVRVYRGSSLIKQIPVSAATTRLTVPGLAPGAAHSFTVYAANAAGTGYVSARSATVVPLR